MICGTGIHDQLSDFFHNLWHWNPRSAPSTCRSQQQACPPCPRTATAEHHSFCTSGPPPSLHNRDIGHLVEDLHNNGHVNDPVQELDEPKRRPAQQGHRPPRTATEGQQRARQQPCPRTARRLHPHHPGTHFGAPGRRPGLM